MRRRWTREEFDETALPKASGTGAPAQLEAHDLQDQPRHRAGLDDGQGPAGRDRAAALDLRPRHRFGGRLPRLRRPQPDARREQLDGLGEARSTSPSTGSTPTTATPATTSVAWTPSATPRADPTLPMWGTGKTEWRGYLTKDQHPHEVNPKHGYFISWNNKPAPGFATDGEYAYSQTYRSVPARPAAEEAARRPPARPGPLRRRARRWRPQPARTSTASPLNDLLVKYVGNRSEPAGVKAMLAQLKSWNAAGSHRHQGQARGRAVRRPRGRRDLRRAGAEPDPRLLRRDLRRRRKRRQSSRPVAPPCPATRRCRCSG